MQRGLDLPQRGARQEELLGPLDEGELDCVKAVLARSIVVPRRNVARSRCSRKKAKELKIGGSGSECGPKALAPTLSAHQKAAPLILEALANEEQSRGGLWERRVVFCAFVSSPTATMSPAPLPASLPAQDPSKHFYLAYGANLHRTLPPLLSSSEPADPARTAKLLSALLGPTLPLTSYTVRIPTAFLSFDFAGIPFVEPCYTSAIVRGVNDGGWSEGLGESERAWGGVEVRDRVEYRRWVWERACPGLEFGGELPPALEVGPLSPFGGTPQKLTSTRA